MKLYKIYDTKIPSMHNTPCKLAVFTDDKGNFKVFQKTLWKTGNHSMWWRNMLFKTVEEVERIVKCSNEHDKIEDETIEPCSTWKRADRKSTRYVMINMGK